MADALKVVPESHDAKIGVERPAELAEALAGALSDTYRLLFKTHGYHWNVEGPLFYSLHNLTEEQYEDMFEAADVIAERIRALGELAPMHLSEIIEKSEIKDADGVPDARHMVTDLVSDHERTARRLRKLSDLAEDSHDPVTHDLAADRAAFHDKAAWMLRSIAAE